MSQSQNKTTAIAASPCVSLCTLDPEDICVGCFRHIDEITGWHGASELRRIQILQNCEQRKEKSPRQS